VIGSELYAGGSFTTAGGVSANRIAKWNGSSWSALGSGMDATVNALAAVGSDLYAGGDFTTAGGVSATRIAKWNGSSWSALGSGLNGTVYQLAVSGSDLYAGGYFTTAGGVIANRIAKWNGSSWSALGSGVNNSVSAFAVESSGKIYAGSDSIRTLSTTALNATSYSAVTNDNGDHVVAYTDDSGLVKVKSFASGTWSAATTIQSSGVSFAPVLSAVSDTNKLYALWFRNGALEYKYFDGTTWDPNPTILVSSASASRFAGCDMASGGGIIKCMLLSGNTSPFTFLSAFIQSL